MNPFPAITRHGLLARTRSLAALLLTASLGACALATDNLASVFTDPAKYDFTPCPELAKREELLAAREQKMRELMDKASQDTGGVVASALAYRTDYLNVQGELKLVREVAQRKDCAPAVKRSQ
jgi:hypothetical protein